MGPGSANLYRTANIAGRYARGTGRNRAGFEYQDQALHRFELWPKRRHTISQLQYRRGRRRQVRDHAGPYMGLHLQHRLLAGGSRRAADQPEPLQPSLSREERFLPGEFRHISVRCPQFYSQHRHHGPEHLHIIKSTAKRHSKRSDAVFQPDHWPV